MRFTSKLQPIIRAKETARMIIALRSIRKNLALSVLSSDFRSRTSDWHRVVSAVAPGMATTDPPYRQPTAAQRAVPPNRFQRVGRTARRKTAMPQWTKQDRLGRRETPAVDAHCKHQNVLGRIHGSLSNLALRNADKKSRSTSARCFPRMDERATSTILTGCRKSC